MKARDFLSLSAILAIALSRTEAEAIECGPLPRIDDEHQRAEIDAQGQVLSRKVGSLDFKGALERSRTDVFSRYPNADRTRLNERLFVVLCQSVSADPALDERQKRDELVRMRDMVLNQPAERERDSRVSAEPEFLVGSWLVVDPRTGVPFTSVEFGAAGRVKSNAFGSDFGGPNGLGANRYILEDGVLKFVYVQPGRARIDEMLNGAVRRISDSEFSFTVVGGYYGSERTVNSRFVFRRP